MTRIGGASGATTGPVMSWTGTGQKAHGSNSLAIAPPNRGDRAPGRTTRVAGGAGREHLVDLTLECDRLASQHRREVLSGVDDTVEHDRTRPVREQLGVPQPEQRPVRHAEIADLVFAECA